MARGALTLAALLLAGGNVNAFSPTSPIRRCRQTSARIVAAVDPASSEAGDGEAVTPNDQALPPAGELEKPQNRVMGLLKKGEF